MSDQELQSVPLKHVESHQEKASQELSIFTGATGMLLSSMAGGLLGLVLSLWFLGSQLAELRGQQDLSPPIAIIDFVAIQKSYPSDAGEEELERLMVRTNNNLFKLKEAGYLIIDASAVISAPDGLYVPPDSFQ